MLSKMHQLIVIVVIIGVFNVDSFHLYHKLDIFVTFSKLPLISAESLDKITIATSSGPMQRLYEAQRFVFRALLVANCLSFAPTFANADSTTAAIDPSTSSQVIDLNINEPKITKTCWLDLKLDTVENGQLERVDIGLYGEAMPITTSNFEALATNKLGFGYKGSDIFRVINDFSVQGGNINKNPNTLPSQRGKEGRAAISENQPSFPVENYNIQHSYVRAGVVSMMKDIKGQQDSRFFITLSPQAGWADNRYSAFGRVTKGMSTIGGLQALDVTPPSNFPSPRVLIEDSGCYHK